MTDQTENPVFAAENTAQTMRNVMAELGKTETLANPAPDKTLIEAALVTTPTGRNHHDLTSAHRAALEYLKPARRKGTARLADLQSLTDWAQRFKGDTSALFAEPDMDAPPALLTITPQARLNRPPQRATRPPAIAITAQFTIFRCQMNGKRGWRYLTRRWKKTIWENLSRPTPRISWIRPPQS